MGKHLKNSCKKDHKGRDIELNLVLINSLQGEEEVKPYLKEIYTEDHTVINACDEVNLRWLIQNRLSLITTPDDSKICQKHLAKYGVKFKPSC